MTYSSSVYSPDEESLVEDLSKLKLLAKWDYEYDLEVYLVTDDGITGGYVGEWKPIWSKLKNAKEIKFHVIEWPYTEEEEEIFA